MTVREALAILTEVDPDRTLYIPDVDGTAQIVTVIGDLKHVNTDLPGVKIPDDVYLMTSRQFEEFGAEDDNQEEETNENGC